MFGVGIFVTFAQRYKLSGTTGIARGLPLKLNINFKNFFKIRGEFCRDTHCKYIEGQN